MKRKRSLSIFTILCCILCIYLIYRFATNQEDNKDTTDDSKITAIENSKTESPRAPMNSAFSSELENVTLNKVDFDAVKSLDVGSEGPRIVYADENTVIFECVDLFVYDLKEKKISNSYNIRELCEKNYEQGCVTQCYGLMDGKTVLLGVFNDPASLKTLYRITLEDSSCTKISTDLLQGSMKNVYTCIEPDRGNPLLASVLGFVGQISEEEFVYLTSDMTVGGIVINHIKKNKLTSYHVFGE